LSPKPKAALGPYPSSRDSPRRREDCPRTRPRTPGQAHEEPIAARRPDPASLHGNRGILPAMRLLVADAFPKEKLADLVALGLDVIHRPDLAAADIPGALEGVQILVVRGKEV